MKQYDGFVTVTAEDIGCDPRIPKGAQLLCSEKIKPQNGDYVLVKRGSASPFIRGYFVREDGSILLKSFNKDADSYVASAQALNAAGIMVVIRMEHDFPAASRVVIPEPEKAESVLPQEHVSAHVRYAPHPVAVRRAFADIRIAPAPAPPHPTHAHLDAHVRTASRPTRACHL